LSSWADGTNTIAGNGGNGATLVAYNCVVGGTATGGDVNIQGGTGTWFNSMKCTGGSSVLGFGGCGGYTTAVPIQDPSGYGGGSGGNYIAASRAATGGIVIVWEYK
jgi:hypothetical protein